MMKQCGDGVQCQGQGRYPARYRLPLPPGRGGGVKGSALIQFVFDIDTVFKGKKFLVIRNIFTHHVPPSTAVRRRGGT